MDCYFDKKKLSYEYTKIELLKEAMDLKRKLNVDFDFELDRMDGTPLMIYQVNLDSNLTKMREKYWQKMNQIKKFIETQQLLCDDLGEDPRTLSTEPLASDSEIDEFENYLLDLESERSRRFNEITCLQHEIQALCNEMGIEKSHQSETMYVVFMCFSLKLLLFSFEFHQIFHIVNICVIVSILTHSKIGSCTIFNHF